MESSLPMPDARGRTGFLDSKNIPLVKLAISTQETVDKNWDVSDRDFHICLLYTSPSPRDS